MKIKNVTNKKAIPFLKWPGGKRWLITKINEVIGSSDFNYYFEPFLGGGALLFSLTIQNVIASDINQDLINVYQQVKYQPNRIIQELMKLKVNKTTYCKLKKQTSVSALMDAVRFLFLNRTAFGGMYRLNRLGEFNVPFGGGGRTPNILWEKGILKNASMKLKKVQLFCEDFESVIEEAGKNDLVYCDPTYTTAHSDNGFVRYNEKNFSWEDQERLAETVFAAASRGATVVVSNAYHKDVKKLYNGAQVHLVNRKSLLCPISKYRGNAKEYLFVVKPQ